MPLPKRHKRRATARQTAVALGYDIDKDAAPHVVAKGHGAVAERILELAKENKIHIRRDPDLAGILAELDVGAMIPTELFPAIVEVLAYVYRLNQRRIRPSSAKK